MKTLCILALTLCLAAPALAGGFEDDVLAGINAARKGRNLPELARDARLDNLALEHSMDMARLGKLSHEGFQARFERSGADFCVENAAYNMKTPQAVVQGWTDSSGHNKNVMAPEIRRAGIGRDGAYVTFMGCR